MRIRLEVDGGLADLRALAAPVTVDTSTLSAANAARLNELVETAHVWSRVDAVAFRATHEQQYTLTVEDAGASRRLVVNDSAADSSLRSLLEFIRAIHWRNDG